LLLYCFFIASLLLLYCFFIASLLLLYCFFIASLLLLYCFFASPGVRAAAALFPVPGEALDSFGERGASPSGRSGGAGAAASGYRHSGDAAADSCGGYRGGEHCHETTVGSALRRGSGADGRRRCGVSCCCVSCGRFVLLPFQRLRHVLDGVDDSAQPSKYQKDDAEGDYGHGERSSDSAHLLRYARGG
jgi:hypothetical protein